MISFWLRNIAFGTFLVVMLVVLEGRPPAGRRRRADGVSVSERFPAAIPRLTDPRDPASKRDLWIVFWIFPAFFGLFGVVFVVLLRVIPPPRPDVGYDYMTEFFEAHHTTIPSGSSCCAWSSAGMRSPTATWPTR